MIHLQLIHPNAKTITLIVILGTNICLVWQYSCGCYKNTNWSKMESKKEEKKMENECNVLSFFVLFKVNDTKENSG